MGLAASWLAGSCWSPVVLVMASLLAAGSIKLGWTETESMPACLACLQPLPAADKFLNHRGKAAAFAAARQQLTPHAAAALQLAIQHLLQLHFKIVHGGGIRLRAIHHHV